jgi:hypothetical protein
MMHLEMKNQQLFGLVLVCLKIEFLTFQKKIIGGLQVILDLVDQILKYFTGYEIVNFHQKEVMFEMTKKIGWKSGIMYLWNSINCQMVV